jgi:hypothetical protein
MWPCRLHRWRGSEPHAHLVLAGGVAPGLVIGAGSSCTVCEYSMSSVALSVMGRTGS